MELPRRVNHGVEEAIGKHPLPVLPFPRLVQLIQTLGRAFDPRDAVNDLDGVAVLAGLLQ